MESTIVIKVKYGETLRRFNAHVIEEQLDLDMVRLRKKILGLFKFAPDADLTLTYIDEDGDVVTLADEDDLCDVVRQSLNPLRITVRLTPEKSGGSYARSSGDSTPMRSPRGQNPIQNGNSSVSEILKYVPEPLREVVYKMSSDLASKSSSSGPGVAGLAELVDTFSKVGLTYLGQNLNVQAGHKIGALNTTSDMKGQPILKVDVAPPEKLPGTKSEASTLEGNQSPLEPSSKSKEAGLKKIMQDVDATGLPPPGFPRSQVKSLPELSPSDIQNVKVSVCGNMCKPRWGNVPAVAKKDVVKSKQVNGDDTGFGFVSSNTDYLKRCFQDTQTMGMDSGLLARPKDSGSSSAWHYGANSFNECPFTGMPLANDFSVPPMLPHFHNLSPFRSYNHGDGGGSVFHRGVRCDGCGVHPITGPRYKSKVKDDYDLCIVCFARMGNEPDYIRLDFPIALPRVPFKGMHDPSRICPPSLPQGGFRVKSTKFKLDNHFIQDVNVHDGTIMAPLTPFTKIWRMRNSGITVWPRGSKLSWIGGDRLRDALTLELEIPAEGLPVGKELDIAVDFTAPEFTGRYVSYWRMASPSGQMFGQRVWVLIQVDASLKYTSKVSNGLNLNLPPVGSGPDALEIDNMNVEPLVEGSFPELYSSNRVTELVEPTVDENSLVEGSFPEPYSSNRVTELVEPTVDENSNKDPELSFPINDSLLVGGGSSSNVNPGPSSAPHHIIGFSPEELPPTDVQASAGQGVNVNIDREERLLRELEEMGFKQVDLNKEILRMNEYDLEQSVDALCGFSEWDPILEELNEMGFSDFETNKRLLRKNNGSIKHVVMDLINGEKA